MNVSSTSSKNLVFGTAILIISGVIVTFFIVPSGLNAYAQQPLQNASEPTTIKVTGESTMPVKQDQVTIVINTQTQPGKLDAVLAKQQDKNNQIVNAVQQVVGDAKGTQITIGTQNLNQQYSSPPPVQNSKNVTFNVYATVGIRTDIDHLADLVNRLSDAGFGFQSVSIDPAFTTALAREAAESYGGGVAIGGIGPVPSSGSAPVPPTSNATASNATSPIILGVSVSTAPNTLNKAIGEYTQKYKELLDLLKAAKVSISQIQLTNLNINPNYYTPPTQNVTYASSTAIYVSTNIANTEKVIAAAQKAGGLAQNLYLSASDSAIDDARKALYQKAIENATNRAQEIAQPLGLEVKAIMSIDAAAGPTQYGGGVSATYRGLHLVQIESNPPPNPSELSASVTVEFELATRT